MRLDVIKVLTPMGVIKISQREVQEFLEKHPKEWFTSKQISEEIGIGVNSCTKNIHSLIKHQLIRRREAGKRYSYEYSYGKNEEY